jgi:hypothetical protein
VVLGFPLAVVLIGVTLGLAGISGSSISLYGDGSSNHQPIVGRARPVRFDEYYVRTPLVVRQSELGFPRRSALGVGTHDMGVLANQPISGWENVLRPQLVPYQIFGVDQAFALEWWLVQLILPALGVYALLLAARLRVATAALSALVFVFSPAMQWWTATGLGQLVGYGGLAAAALVFATRWRRPIVRYGAALAAGWLLACFLAVLYLPWLVTIALIVGAVGVAAIAHDLFDRGRPGRALLVEVAPVVAVAAVVGGVLFLAFLRAHREAIALINHSVYPGDRHEHGGGGTARLLFNAPFDAIQSLNARAVLPVNGVNQSEASGGVFTLLAVAAALAADPVRAFLGSWRDRIVLWALLAISAVLVVWYFVAVPAWIGQFLLLDKVPTNRLLPPLALASTLALGLFTAARTNWKPKLRARAAIAGTAIFGVCTAWAAIKYSIDGHIAPWQLVALTSLFVCGVGLTLWRGTLGLVVLVVLLGFSAVVVNPLQRGLEPLTESAGAKLGQTLRERPGTGSVVFFANDPGGDIKPQSALTSSGVANMSAVNLYPVRRAWRELDRDGGDEHAWNRYATALWGVAPEGDEPRVFRNTEDSVIVMVDPCEGTLQRIGVHTVVSFVRLDRFCLQQTDRIRDGARSLWVYRIDPTRPRPGRGGGDS